jgi:hypothetical protein
MGILKPSENSSSSSGIIPAQKNRKTFSQANIFCAKVGKIVTLSMGLSTGKSEYSITQDGNIYFPFPVLNSNRTTFGLIIHTNLSNLKVHVLV